MTIWLRLASRLADLLFKPFVGEIAGLEHFPPGGPGLVVANHLSVFDGPVLAAIANTRARQVHFMTYRQFMAVPFIGHLLRLNGAIGLDETTWEGRQHALQTCRRALAEGRVLGIFPEAHIARFDGMLRAQPGAAMLALETGVPVVPVGLAGTEKVIPRKGDLPGVRWKAIAVRFGPPLDLARYVELFARSDRRQRLDIALGVTTIIMRAVAVLSGQVYPHGTRFLQRLERLSLGSTG